MGWGAFRQWPTKPRFHARVLPGAPLTYVKPMAYADFPCGTWPGHASARLIRVKLPWQSCSRTNRQSSLPG